MSNISNSRKNLWNWTNILNFFFHPPRGNKLQISGLLRVTAEVFFLPENASIDSKNKEKSAREEGEDISWPRQKTRTTSKRGTLRSTIELRCRDPWLLCPNGRWVIVRRSISFFTSKWLEVKYSYKTLSLSRCVSLKV